jgi:hypothetical protein
LVGRFGPALRLFAHTTRALNLDHASVTLTFAKGPIVQWVGTCRGGAAHPRTSIELCGTGGMIQCTTDDVVLEVSRIVGKSSQSVQRSNPLSPSFAVRHLSRFMRVLESKPELASYKHDAAVLAVLDAAFVSARTGREIRL